MSIIIDGIVGKSPELQAVLNAAGLVAAADVSVLILGESGTGKELLAHSVHALSRRSNQPFVSINCAALPEALVESELFGHRKGAFTGADAHYEGRIRAANGGSVFLDEVAELPLAAQAKLLRFLESRECQAVGETTPRKVDVRVIAATNRDLLALVCASRFREDLYYRLNVVPLELPALRARRGDVPHLVRHYLQQLARQHNVPLPTVSAAAMERLRAYAWPGNVRELRNFCERMVVLLRGAEIGIGNLPAAIRGNPPSGVSAALPLPAAGVSLYQVERDLIVQALVQTGGNRSRAARLLGLTRDTLLYRLKKYSLAGKASE
jgi:DNA-binding NtrC family response regulator